MSKIPAIQPQQEQNGPPPVPEEAGGEFQSVSSTEASQEQAPRPTPEEPAQRAEEHEQTAEEQMRQARQQLREAQRQMEAAQRKLQDAHDHMEACVAAQNPDYFASRPLDHLDEDEQDGFAPAQASAEAEHASAEEMADQGHYGALDGLFRGLAKIAPVALLLVLAAMTWPMFLEPGKGVYCPAEIKSLSAFIHCIASNSWLAPTGLENGAFSLPLWPVFSLTLGLFAFIPGLVDTGLLLPVATFSCAFLAAFAVWALALAAGFGGRAAFAAGIIILATPIFAPLPHFMGPAALAAALMLLALAFFNCGWRSETAFISLPLAFIFTALAGLCGGLLHFAVPLIASLFFLIWRGNLRRAQRLDAIFGFILMLAVLGVWLGMLMLDDSKSAYLTTLLHGSYRYAMPIPLKWLLPIIVGLLGVLPWLLAIFGVSWFHVLARSAKSLGASRHENGSALVWIALILALVGSVFVPAFHLSAIVIACLAAVLLGKAFIHFSHGGNRFFFLLASVFMILAGVLLNALTYPESQNLILSYLPAKLPVPDLPALLLNLSGLQIMGYICIGGGILGLLFVRRYKASGGLVLAAVILIALCQPARLMLVPELAAHAGTPLVSYAAVEKQALSVLTPKPVETAKPAEAAPVAPEAAADSPTAAQEAPQPAPQDSAQKPEAVSPVAPDAAKAPQAPDAPAVSQQAPEAGAASPEKTEEIIVIEETVTAPAEEQKDKKD